MSNKSIILVIIQFLCFAFFLFNRNLIANNIWIIFQITGFIISAWGVLAMKIGNFNIQPEVRSNARFITKGPYKIIRNPMYAGLILFFGASIISSFSSLRLLVFVILILIFLLKIKMEEIFLSKAFGDDFQNHKKRTYRLIPFIY
jgi:protein-S-isoprenylcysteine O-methyltransferase Ste14